MKVRMASLAIGCLLMAGTPALAQQTTKLAAAKPAPSAARGKAIATKNAHAALPAAYAAVPEPERLSIQADLAWLGHFDGLSAEEIGARTLDAIKAFQRRNGGKETGVLSDQERDLLADAARSREATVGWRLIDDSATGARIGVPEKLVPRAGTTRIGSRWSSALGQVQIESFSLHDASLPALFEQEKTTSRRRVDYSALEPDSFIIIGEQLLKKFVVRAQSNGSEVRGVTIRYDQATEGTMAAVAIAIADTFDGFPGPNAGSVMGHRRGVEYGTAIIVSDRGDLLGIAGITEGCQAITVPGYGHADVVGTDKTNGLALLRLYGARNLTPASLGGDAGAATDLTLFGVADPLAQSGGGAASSAAAELTGQGIAPAPNLGFSGAAAFDGQGRFAGLVALKSAVVAGAGPLAPQAALVPAAAVRAFLVAHGIATAARTASIDQSVVRLICVRK